MRNALYVICVDNSGYQGDLVLHKVYKVIPVPKGDKAGMVRVMDETGEDYLYVVDRFLPLELPEAVQEAMARMLA